jgi:AraC family transcriptional regulator
LLCAQPPNPDFLRPALRRKARTNAPGAARGRALAAGPGWRAVDIVCTSGPGDRPFEEQHAWASISIVLSGTFVYRGAHGSSLMSAGAMLLGNPGTLFECSHPHGEGDRCLSFQYDPELFDRFAHDAGASRFAFAGASLPPSRLLAPIAARAACAMETEDSLEEIALELAGAVIGAAGHSRRKTSAAPGDAPAIARVLRHAESRAKEPLTLDAMAQVAKLSRYHFLRRFKSVTGVTPHQWLLRARLREGARRLATTPDPVTDIALDAGFEDLSNFIRSFRAEFGVSPRLYRTRALHRSGIFIR